MPGDDIVWLVIDLDEAQRFVLDRIARLDPIELPAGQAFGLVLAEDVSATAPVPPFANTAMDGVAVRSGDLVVDPATGAPVPLLLVGTVAAGAPASSPLGAGEAMRIMTGAPMPDGADAVVMVEHCRFVTDGSGDEYVHASEPVESGTHVRPVGDDVRPGDVVLRAGTVISAGGISLLRTLGRSNMQVVPRPRVGVLSTGDELVEPPAELGPGQIYDSNRAALLALVTEAGCEAVDLGLIADDETAIESTLRSAAANCDAVISSGGVSMGDFDLVKAVLDRIGDMEWMQIAIRPAKPFAFGRIDGVPIFGLPGNPVSSLVSFELLARPALRLMAGQGRLLRPTTAATAGEAMRRRPDGKIHFVRVVVSLEDSGRLIARSAGAQGSHQLSAMALANGFAVLVDGDGVDAGDEVPVLLFAEPA